MFTFRASITLTVMIFVVALAALLIAIQVQSLHWATREAASAYMDAASTKALGRLQGELNAIASLVNVLEIGEQNGALAGIISGSGPTVAFLAADTDSALELQIALSAAQLNVVRATGPVHGARVIGD